MISANSPARRLRRMGSCYCLLIRKSIQVTVTLTEWHNNNTSYFRTVLSSNMRPALARSGVLTHWIGSEYLCPVDTGPFLKHWLSLYIQVSQNPSPETNRGLNAAFNRGLILVSYRYAARTRKTTAQQRYQWTEVSVGPTLIFWTSTDSIWYLKGCGLVQCVLKRKNSQENPTPTEFVNISVALLYTTWWWLTIWASMHC